MIKIEGLDRVKIKVCKIKKYYFQNNRKRTKIVESIDTYRNVFALIEDENKNIFVYNNSSDSNGCSRNIKKINKGDEYIIYVRSEKCGNKYKSIDYMIRVNDLLEIESLSLDSDNVPYRVFRYTKGKENLINITQNNFDVNILHDQHGVYEDAIIWLLDHCNINNKLYEYAYINKMVNNICKEKGYEGTNANEIYEKYKSVIDDKFKEININDILQDISDYNILIKTEEGNYFPYYFTY